MGLDMYLYAKQFASSLYGSPEESILVKEIAKLMKGEEFLEEDELQFAGLKLQVAYWRKANQIHQFFVNRCGNGKDECQDMYVEKDDLKELLNRCETVLKDKSQAEKLLPTQAGFFFGSTDYNEYYYDDLERTVPILKKILEFASESWEFEYRASW